MSPKSEEVSNKEICVCVDGVKFLLVPDTIAQFGSPLLNSLIQNPIKQQRSEPILIHRVDADAETFFSFVQMVRYGTLPISVFISQQKHDQLLEQADVWGIRPAVLDTISKTLEDLRRKASTKEADKEVDNTDEDIDRIQEKKVRDCSHHNHRKQDSGAVSFGSYCTAGLPEKKAVFLEGESYRSCKNCGKEIPYQANLGYCHKCSYCLSCQQEQRDQLPSLLPMIQPRPSSESNVPSLFSALDEKIRSLRDSL